MELKEPKQVKSRQRVADHGEVFTAEREVNAMLDLVRQETERIDARFLEPACGTGNFLVEVLRRKLAVVGSRYGRSQTEWERYAVLAVTSLYGVDLLPDNVVECRARLLAEFEADYARRFARSQKAECRRSVRYVLRQNILWGDALSMKTPNAAARPIRFAEWSAVNGNLLKRRDYTLANLLQSQPLDGPNLFSDLGDQAFIPKPVGDYPLVHFLDLGQDDQPDQL
jgi:hypothetical protein